MTPEQQTALITLGITTWGIVNGWLIAKAKEHDKKLDGLMAPRIAEGAAAVVVADHAARGEKQTLKQP